MDNNIVEIVNRFKKSNQRYCQFQGVKDSYGKVDDYNKDSFNKRIVELKRDIQYLREDMTNIEKTSGIAKIDLLTLYQVLENELFQLEELKDYKKNPNVYLGPLETIQSIYIARSYAPLTERVRHILATEKTFLTIIKQAPINLDPILAKVKIHLTVQSANSLIAYLRDELLEEIVKIEEKELIEEWSKVNVEVVKAIENYIKLLQEEYLPKGTEEFALGTEKYLKMLEKSDGIKISIEKLLKVAEEDLDKNYSALMTIKKELGEEEFKKTHEEHPREEELVQETEKSMQRAKEFITEKKLVSIPFNETCQVIETPGPMRATTFAAMNPANIAEESEATESYYYITPPDKKWTEEEREDYMKTFNRGTLETVTVHEVWPGHFLHFLHIKRLSPLARLLSDSYATIEGWAHYTEELAIEYNYEKINPIQFRIGQLTDALIRNCRFVASIKMHNYGMKFEEAKNLFIEKALLSEKGSEMEAKRGTVDPMYIKYTLGKLIIKKIREDYKKEKGTEFEIREFHDTFMSYGGIPLALIRKSILEKNGLEEDIL